MLFIYCATVQHFLHDTCIWNFKRMMWICGAQTIAAMPIAQVDTDSVASIPDCLSGWRTAGWEIALLIFRELLGLHNGYDLTDKLKLIFPVTFFRRRNHTGNTGGKVWEELFWWYQPSLRPPTPRCYDEINIVKTDFSLRLATAPSSWMLPQATWISLRRCSFLETIPEKSIDRWETLDVY